MFAKLVPVSPATDTGTRLSIMPNWLFAGELTAVPYGAHEMEALAGEYVLAFANNEEAAPIVLLGVEGRNSYVNEAGRWTATNIPSVLKAYPLAAAVPKDGGEQVTVLRYEDAPHFTDPWDGVRLFHANGEPSALFNLFGEHLRDSVKGQQQALAASAALSAAGLLRTVRLSVQLNGNVDKHLDGLRVVDQDKLNALGEAERAALEASGALALATAQLRSLSNVPRLFAPVALAAAQAAASSESAPAPKKRAARKASAKADSPDQPDLAGLGEEEGGAKPARKPAAKRSAKAAEAGEAAAKPKATRKKAAGSQPDA